MPEPDGPPRAVIVAAVTLAVATIAGILAFAASRDPSSHPVAIARCPAPQAAAPPCRSLMAALPQRSVTSSARPWRSPRPTVSALARRVGGEPVILRCGLDRPADFVVGSPIQIVDRVQWFEIAAQSGENRSTWYTVDRPVYVALTLPAGSGPTPIQQLSEVIDHTIAAVPINPAPAG
ncbi:DUF3515 domain-containing protein [Mycobacterium szulgai]|uniref:DUF3515 domain-containing protein n=1 Tax=Mycobacterium szulgai TaxID=1787 RepID=UPI0021F2C494|nr:DUF3515 domain-containing protein [Mycobacterium szulgai]